MRLKVVALALILVAGSVLAATFNVTFTAGQDTAIQTQLIPLANAEKCLKYGLATNCVTANLSGRCTAVALSKTAFEACTIYSLDATGETAFLQDEVSYHLLARFKVLSAQNAVSFTQACQLDAATTATNAQCAAVSLSNGCIKGDVDCVLHGLVAGCNPCP